MDDLIVHVDDPGEGIPLATIDTYLDIARKRGRFRSDRKLARALGVTPATVNAWRMKRQWPSEEAIIKLADLADITRELALMDLRLWGTKSVEVQSCYEKIKKEIMSAGVSVAIYSIAAFTIATSLLAAPTGTHAEQINAASHPLYIMENK